MKTFDYNTRKKKLEAFNIRKQQEFRDRPYRPLPISEGVDMNSSKWQTICRAFHIMNLPTVKERRSAINLIPEDETGKKIIDIIRFYDDYFQSKTF